jgi:hypothetical protein
MVLPPGASSPAKPTKQRSIGTQPRSTARRPTRPPLPPLPPNDQAELAIAVLPPDLAALRNQLPPDIDLPLDVLATIVIPRVPRANAFLTAWSYLLRPDFLDDLYARLRGRTYENALTFPCFVELIRDALVLHEGSGLASFADAKRRGALPVSEGAVYSKLRHIPEGLSLGFLEEVTAKLRSLLPEGARAEVLPASLDEMAVVILDGKKIRHVAKRLLPLRNKPGKIVGGKILVAYLPREGLAASMAADPDGEANDIRLMPEAIPRARARIRGPRLYVVDRQFCDLNQPVRLTEEGDHYLIRRNLKMLFEPDPERPTAEYRDALGRQVIERWGWIGAPRQGERRQYVRQIHLIRPDEEDVYLITDLLDNRRYPADDLLSVYLERWGIERVFQKIVEVFGLQQLIGCSPEATIFRAAFCLVIYNLLEVMRAFVAAGREDMAVESVSLEKLFEDVHKELTAMVVLFPAEEIAAGYAAAWTESEVAERLAQLLGGAWRERYRKAVNKRPRPNKKQAKQSGAHTSVHKVLQAERKKRRGTATHDP